MSITAKNGPAFPWTGLGDEGLNKLDYFAAKAMEAVIARGDDTNRPGIAEWSYSMAYAMLKEREKYAQCV